MTVSMHTFSGISLNDAVASHVLTLGGASSFVQGFGFVKDAVVRVGEQEVRVGAGTLVSLTGSVYVDGSTAVFRATVVLSHSVGGVPVMIGGELVSARAEGVECCFAGSAEPVQRSVSVPSPSQAKPPSVSAKTSAAVPSEKAVPAPAKPHPEKQLKLSTMKEPAASAPVRRPTAAKKPKATSADWARVLAASEGMSSAAADGEIDVDELERGDVLLHPSLDECMILAVISDDAVKVRLPNGSVRKLVMRNFRLFADGEGRFRVEKRAKS